MILGGVVQPADGRADNPGPTEDDATEPDSAEETSPKADDLDSDSDSEPLGIKVTSEQGQTEVRGQLKSELKERSLLEVTSRKKTFFRRPGLNLTRSLFKVAEASKKSGTWSLHSKHC